MYFRTALLRAAPRAARVSLPSSARNFWAAARPVRVAVPRVQAVKAVRMYSAGGGLNKEEVEGRIISLLSGFDKVSCDVRLMLRCSLMQAFGSGLALG